MIGVLCLVLCIITTVLGAFLADAAHLVGKLGDEITGLEQENDDLRNRLADHAGVAAYSCPRCGARMGVAGAGPEEAELFRADVEWHTTGLCTVQPFPARPLLRYVRGEQ